MIFFRLKRLAPDPYIVAILTMVIAASLLPVRGILATDFSVLTKAAIALLFFLHGAKLSREAILGGLTHWRLHLTVISLTFVLFPIAGLVAQQLPDTILPRQLASGVLFLCCLPSTVQSSIAFTAMARGNVAAAVCAASLSNLFGIFLTPLLLTLIIGAHGSLFSAGEVEAISLQLLLPFLMGQIFRKWIGAWLSRHGRLIGLVDRGSILLVVYGAFSAAVVAGIWKQVSALQIFSLAIICIVLLGAILIMSVLMARGLAFPKADEITIVFCGSKKSLASGVPMAGILFPPASVGLMVLPLMLFHQIQLMVCAVVAQRYSARSSIET